MLADLNEVVVDAREIAEALAWLKACDSVADESSDLVGRVNNSFEPSTEPLTCQSFLSLTDNNLIYSTQSTDSKEIENDINKAKQRLQRMASGPDSLRQQENLYHALKADNEKLKQLLKEERRLSEKRIDSLKKDFEMLHARQMTSSREQQAMVGRC